MDKLNVLIVDDEKFETMLLRKTLQQEKRFEIYETTNPFKALRILKKRHIHLIISDHHMPQMTGLQLLNQAKQHSPHTIRLITTASPDGDSINEAYLAGLIHQYIAKPWHPQALLITLQNAIEHFQLKTEKEKLAKALKQNIQMIRDQVKTVENFDELKRQFMMVANHELRTPATIITSSLDVLVMQKEKLDATQLRLITNALGGVRRLNKLLEMFYGILRFNQAHLTEGLASIYLSRLLTQLHEDVAPHLKSRSIELKIDCDASYKIRGEYDKIYQTFFNLLSNSIKYTPDNGSIVIQVRRLNDDLLISIRDSGIGIAKDQLKNIFQDFYQVNDAINHHSSQFAFMGGGAGLGLSYCKSIVKAHLGEIWAKSEGENEGSTFYIKLPVLKEIQLHQKPAAAEFMTEPFFSPKLASA